GQIALIGDEAPISVAAVQRAAARLVELGYRSAHTGAVPETLAGTFLATGFRAHERLHLLSHPLRQVEGVPRGSTRRARRGDRRAVLAVDHAAFEPYWQLDETSLEESLLATPVTRFRVTDHGGVD